MYQISVHLHLFHIADIFSTNYDNLSLIALPYSTWWKLGLNSRGRLKYFKFSELLSSMYIEFIDGHLA